MAVLPLWAIAAIVVTSIDRIFVFIAGRKKTRYLPGLRSAFTPVSLFGALLPTSRFNPGLSWQWLWRNKVYQQYGSETISVLPYLSGRPSVYTSSVEVARQVVSTRGQFIKPADTSKIVMLWGNNIFATNGSEWKRHRRIMAPAFSHETYALVWKETCLIYQEMCEEEGWNTSQALNVPSINELTTKMALIIISRCGFGKQMPWNLVKNAKNEMTFAEALVIVSNSSIVRLVTPRWMYYLPIKRLHDIEKAYNILAEFMRSLIETRRREIVSGQEPDRSDVFSLMIRASEAEGKSAMNDDELSGNTFLMLFAGHETTAHTLDAALGFLALYEDIQQEVYQHIAENISKNGLPTYDEAHRLYKVEACFLEAARLFPAGFMMIRDTTEDVVLTTYGENGATGQVPLEAGMRVVVDVVGMHYNPRHFPEPEEFRPSRWYNAHENDLSMFSLGPRACIGRRFAITEAVCFLTLLLRDWKLEIILHDGETRSQWRERVMRGYMTMTLGVGTIPLRFVRRA